MPTLWSLLCPVWNCALLRPCPESLPRCVHFNLAVLFLISKRIKTSRRVKIARNYAFFWGVCATHLRVPKRPQTKQTRPFIGAAHWLCFPIPARVNLLHAMMDLIRTVPMCQQRITGLASRHGGTPGCVHPDTRPVATGAAVAHDACSPNQEQPQGLRPLRGSQAGVILNALIR